MTLAQALRQDPFMVGFDRIFDRMHTLNQNQSSNYPPYNIVKDGENSYRVEIAVAGFTESELDIYVEDGVLTVEGVHSVEDSGEYLHKGIGARDFKRTFTLSDTVEVQAADIVNGILVISLENIIPEEKKPRRIAIGSSEATLLTEDK